MQYKIQTLRKYQIEADLLNLDKSIYININRLTVLLDTDKQSLRKIYRELRHSLNTVIQAIKNTEKKLTILSFISNLNSNNSNILKLASNFIKF